MSSLKQKRKPTTLLGKVSDIKKTNDMFLPKGLNLNILVVSSLTALVVFTLLMVSGWGTDLALEISVFGFVVSASMVYLTTNFMHIKYSLSTFAYLLIFLSQSNFFIIAKNNYSIDYELLDLSIKLEERKRNIEELEKLELHKDKLEEQLKLYRELNQEKQTFKNMAGSEATNYVDQFLEEKYKK